MNLLNVWVPTVAALLTLAAALGTAWVMPRGRGIVARVRDGVGVVVVAALVCVTVAAASNRAMGWVPTTSHLWRLMTVSDTAPDHIEVLGAPAPAAGGHGGNERTGTAGRTLTAAVGNEPGQEVSTTGQGVAGGQTQPAAPAATTAPATQAPAGPAPLTQLPGEQIWRGTVNGQASGISAPVTVWAPRQAASTAGASRTTFDVIIFLHGFPGSDEGPIQALNVPAVMGQTSRPTLFVVPNLDVDGREPDCVNIAQRPQIETFVTTDVVAAVRQTFPGATTDPSGWLLAGISSGAYCAPVLAMRHPDEFYGAISLGGYDAPELGTLAHAPADVREQVTISHLAAVADPATVHLYVAAARGDRDAETLARRLEGERRAGVDIVVDDSGSGGHSWATWAAQLPGGLRWWADRDERASAAATGAAASDAATSAWAQSAGAGSAQGAGRGGPASLVGAGVVGGDNLSPTAHAAAQGLARAAAERASVRTGTSAASSASGWVEAFGLQGWATAALALTGAVAATGAAPWLGSRTPSRRRLRPAPRHVAAVRGPASRWDAVAARTLMVLAAGAVIAAAAGVLVNREMVVFASWQDLARNWGSLFLAQAG